MLKKNIANSPQATTSIATFAPRTVRTEKIERRTSGSAERDSITTKRDQQHGREREDAEHLAGAPALLGRAHDPVDERDQPGGDRDGAGEVEALVGVLVARLGHEPQREEEGDDADRDVDEEDPGPGEVLDEDAAEQQADGAAADRDRGPDTERLRPLRALP